MSEIFEQMLRQHTINGDNDHRNALYEVMQQVVLGGLYRGGFFKDIDQRELDIWSNDYFIKLADMIEFE